MELKKENKGRTKTEIFSRCVGYYRPIDRFNEGILQSFHDRKLFKIEEKPSGQY